jgi:hypothetical protein
MGTDKWQCAVRIWTRGSSQLLWVSSGWFCRFLGWVGYLRVKTFVEMAKQCGINLFVGTRYGCTGYIMHGLPYIRRRSSLDGDQWKKSAAFVRTREASVVFGGASALAGQIWRGIPKKMRGLMDAGAYNRLVVAVQQTHLQNGASYEFRQGRGKVQAHHAKVVERFWGKHLGRALNGMDMSDGAVLADGVQLGARDQGPGARKFVSGIGEFVYLDGVEGVSLHGLAELARFVPEGAAVRVRLHVARVEALPHRWDSSAKRYLSEGRLQAERAFTTSSWMVLGARGQGPGARHRASGRVSEESNSVSVDLPGRIVAAGDDERWFLNFVALEVGIRIGNGRWRRLNSACKAYVVCNMQGGAEFRSFGIPQDDIAGFSESDGVATPSASEAGVGIGCGVVPTPSAGFRGLEGRGMPLGHWSEDSSCPHPGTGPPGLTGIEEVMGGGAGRGRRGPPSDRGG